MIFASTYLISIVFINIILLCLAFFCLFWATKIALEFDANANTKIQYRLIQKSYLISTVIVFILSLKLPLFLYFIWVLDELSSILGGAMCATGVLSASKYGDMLLIFKIANLFLLSSWLLLNYLDLKSPRSKYMKTKFYFYQVLFFFLLLEFILFLAHFQSISLQTLVSCCSVLFSQNEFRVLPYYHKNEFVLSVFVAFFVLYLIAGFFKKAFLFGVFGICFSASSLYAIVRFFSPYIYELPTHVCPFCMLQGDYYFVGYIIYILLFTACLFSWFTLFLNLLSCSIGSKFFKVGLVANILLVILLCWYPLSYFIKNGVWL